MASGSKVYLFYGPENKLLLFILRYLFKLNAYHINRAPDKYFNVFQNNEYDFLDERLVDWSEVLANFSKTIESKSNINELLNIDSKSLLQFYVQQFDNHYRYPYCLAHLCNKLGLKNFEFVCSVSNKYFSILNQNSKLFNKNLCTLVWIVHSIKIPFIFVKQSIKLALLLLFSTQKNPTNNYNVYFGTTSNDLKMNSSGEPNIISFLKSELFLNNESNQTIILNTSNASTLNLRNYIYSAKSFLQFNNPKRIFNYFYEQIKLFFLIPNIKLPSTFISEVLVFIFIKNSITSNPPKQFIIPFASAWCLPLWITYLSNSGSRLIIFYYAAYEISFLRKSTQKYDTQPLDNYLFAHEFWVWDQKQAKYLISRGISEKLIKIVGPITIGEKTEIIKPAPNSIPTISVYDILPKKLFYKVKAIGMSDDIVIAKNMISFLKDIYEACIEKFGPNNFKLRLKSKRDFSKNNDENYSIFIEEFKLKPEVEHLTSNHNIYDSLSGTHFVISFPYTSVSRLGHYYKIPTVYYDPTKELLPHPDNPIKLLNSKDSLVSWFNNPHLY